MAACAVLLPQCGPSISPQLPLTAQVESARVGAPATPAAAADVHSTAGERPTAVVALAVRVMTALPGNPGGVPQGSVQASSVSMPCVTEKHTASPYVINTNADNLILGSGVPIIIIIISYIYLYR